MIKLYAMPISQPARAVMWLLEWKELEYETINTMPGGKKTNGTKHPTFLKKFPMGTVPSMSYGNVHMSESHAIMKFLCEKHGWDDAYPSDLSTKSRIDEYLHWHHRNTREITLGLFAPIMRPDIKFTKSQIKSSTKAVQKVLSFIERKLNTRKWLCTDASPSVADLAAYCEIGQCQKMYCDLIDFAPYPNIRRWMSQCETIPGYEASHAMLKGISPRIRKQVHRSRL